MDAPRYREVGPDRLPAVLRGLVECAWHASVPSGHGGDHHQRVLPDGCMDLLLVGDRLVVAGPDTAAHTATSVPGSTTTGLRFRPGALPALLGVPADELRDDRVDLADVLGARAGTAFDIGGVVAHDARDDRGVRPDAWVVSGAHRLAAAHPGSAHRGGGDRGGGDRGGGDRATDDRATAGSGAARSGATVLVPAPSGATDLVPAPSGAADHGSARCPSAPLLLATAVRLAAATTDRRRPLPGPLPRWALNALAGGATATDVADRMGVTTRTLHRSCVATLGYGPSVARRVLRFRVAVALLYAGHAPADVAARAGYADQPHLSREVRALAGVSPTALAGPAGPSPM